MRRIVNEGYVRSRVPKGFNLDAARKIQRMLSARVVELPLSGPVDIVVGLDVAYRGERAFAVAAAYSISRKAVVEYSCYDGEVTFPYVPTLLSFRELAPMVRAYRRISTRPHVVMIDGHGVAHPYRLGIAAHFGVTMRVPTIGVAKSLLYGEIKDGFILDPNNGDIIGAIVKCGLHEVYVSVGNLVTLRDAVNLTKILCIRDRMPEPILSAHNLANMAKRRGC